MNAAPAGAPSPAAFETADGYLRAADEAGLLSLVDGLPVVAGEYVEPVTGELQCLVEHADPRLIARAPMLLDALFRRHRDCSSAVVRLPGRLPAPAELQPLLTYLEYTPASPPPTEAPASFETTFEITLETTFEITEAADDDEEPIARWLARAIHDAAAERGHTGGREGGAQAVRQLLTSPDRRSYLVRVPGTREPVGHATILTDAYDDVSDTPFVELVDILVDDDALRRTATAALVAVCARTAAAHGTPLIGNVAHPLPLDGRDPAAGAVAALRRRGWTPTHRYRYAARP
ncbi:hypothetical protein ACFZDG_19770 [Kitasatospora xanthocidica]|uniref:hypothetical protein n=1 Tax=Kitasatospora xanthocidica TaxID=83382 RepID=UPI0036E855DC